MGIEVDLLKVGDGSKSGDAIALRFGELHGERNDQFVMVIDCGFGATGPTLVDFVEERYNTDWIDLLVCTHPDLDHAGGLEAVINGLEPREVWMHLPWEHSGDIRELFHDGRITDQSLDRRIKETYDHIHRAYELCLEKEIPVTEPFSDTIGAAGYEELGVFVLGPTRGYYQSLLPHFRGTPQAKKDQETREQRSFARALRNLGQAVAKLLEDWFTERLEDPGPNDTAAENNSSAILYIVSGADRYLFSADAGVGALQGAIDDCHRRELSFADLSFFKVPHHGSRHNIGPTVLDQILGEPKPKESELTISCAITATAGDEGHPSKRVVNALIRRGGKVLTTVNGNKWIYRDAPERSDYVTVTPLPLFAEVEDD